jgi:hypothetical protein
MSIIFFRIFQKFKLVDPLELFILVCLNPFFMRKIYLPIALATLFLFDFNRECSAQVEVQTDLTVETLVNTFFNSGILVNISNITFNGASPDQINHQIALFGNGLTDSLFMESGLVLATSSAAELTPENEIFPITYPYPDTDVEMLSGGYSTTRCALLEFDVQVDADALAFDFVFGSKEYASYTCSNFNDTFGFFISGPGIVGPYSNNAINIATIPGTDTPIAINSVNGGVPTGAGQAANCEAVNPNWIADSQYFVSNYPDTVSSATISGYTTKFEAYVEVIFGETYHLKLAVCDVIDIAFQSVVLLESGSFEGRMLTSTSESNTLRDKMKLYPNPSNDIVYITNLEGSNQDQLRVSVRNIQGREVMYFQSNTSGRIELPVVSLEKGIYIANIYRGNELVSVNKFVRD